MSKKNTTVAGVTVSVLIIASIAAIGYYQFVVGPTLTATSTTTTSINVKAVVINMTVGAATKTNDAYAPATVTLVIGVNNTVEWYNADLQGGTGIPHTATANTKVGGAPVFDTGVISAGSTSQPFTIKTPGTYTYFCQIHPLMVGKIVVLAAGSGATTGSTQASAA